MAPTMSVLAVTISLVLLRSTLSSTVGALLHCDGPGDVPLDRLSLRGIGCRLLDAATNSSLSFHVDSVTTPWQTHALTVTAALDHALGEGIDAGAGYVASVCALVDRARLFVPGGRLVAARPCYGDRPENAADGTAASAVLLIVEGPLPALQGLLQLQEGVGIVFEAIDTAAPHRLSITLQLDLRPTLQRRRSRTTAVAAAHGIFAIVNVTLANAARPQLRIIVPALPLVATAEPTPADIAAPDLAPTFLGLGTLSMSLSYDRARACASAGATAVLSVRSGVLAYTGDHRGGIL